MARSFFPIPGSIGHEDHGGQGIFYNEEGISDERWQATIILAALIQGKLACGMDPDLDKSIRQAKEAVKRLNEAVK